MKNIALFWPQRLFILGIICLFFYPTGSAQQSLDKLKDRLSESYGKDKLAVLNELITFHLSEKDAKQALRYARMAETLADDIISLDNKLISQEDYYLKPLTFIHLGQAHQQLGQYAESKTAYEKALADAKKFKLQELVEQAQQSILEIDSLSLDAGKKKKNFLGKAFRDISSSIEKTTDNLDVMASIRLAKMYEKNENYEGAINKYNLAINQLRDKGDWQQIEELRRHVADLKAEKGDIPGAVNSLTEIQEEKKKAGDDFGVASIQQEIEVISQRNNLPIEAPQRPASAEEQVIAKATEEIRDIKTIAEQAENRQDFKKSLDYYKQYLALEQTLAEQEKLQELMLLEKAHQIDNQEKEITLLRQNEEISHLQLQQKEIELARQHTFRRNMAVGLILLATLVCSLYLLYYNKRRDHQKLGLAFENLEVAQNQLKTAEQRIKGLLNQQVSGAVANALLAAEGEQKVQRKFVCIMFLDIRNFTPFVEKLSPEDIINYQNNVLGFMIETVHKRKGIVNQILGDGFMATFGAPVSAGNDCMEAYLAAQEIIENVKCKSESGEIPATRVGIGLHAGYVVAGNVGTKDRKQYSITGNPVIIAARLEQLNKEYGSTMVVSKEVYDHLPADLREPKTFNEVMVKGRSKSIAVATF